MKSRAHVRRAPRVAACAALLGVAALASGRGEVVSAAPGARGITVSAFFSRGDPGPSCRRVFARPRSVVVPGVLRGAVTQLLRGPTAAERRLGYGGWFSARTVGMLRSVRIARGVAYVDFRDLRPVIPNASSSCGSALLLAQLNRTATQFATVDRAVYSINGSRKTFYEWLQLSAPRG
jgi:hypothetical protein